MSKHQHLPHKPEIVVSQTPQRQTSTLTDAATGSVNKKKVSVKPVLSISETDMAISTSQHKNQFERVGNKLKLVWLSALGVNGYGKLRLAPLSSPGVEGYVKFRLAPSRPPDTNEYAMSSPICI
jgi:hypothetical protein